MCTISKTSLCLINMCIQLYFKDMPAAHWTKILAAHEALHFLAFPLLSPVVSGGPTLYSKQGLSRKSNILSSHFPVLPSSFPSCWWGVTLCSKGGRLFVGACRVLFVVMIAFHEAFVYIPNPKNRASLWQHRCRLTCDMPAHFLSECLTPSLNLFPSISLWLPVTFLLTSHFHLSTSSWSDLSFPFLWLAFLFTPSSASDLHGAVKIVMILDNAHFVGYSHSLLAAWKHRYNSRVGLL